MSVMRESLIASSILKYICAILVILHSTHARIDDADQILENESEEAVETTTIGATTLAPSTASAAAPNITTKLPSIFGMRVELPPDNPFGYNPYGICAVAPDEEFKIVIYGNHLDKVDKLIFTVSDNCSDPAYVVDPVNSFLTHFQHKAAFKMSLRPVPPVEEGRPYSYKICAKPKGVPISEIAVLEDISTWLTTEKPDKEYLLPLPVQIGVIVLLLCLSALFSGLTLGLMSLTPMELELVIKSGSPKEQEYAKAILPIRKKGNLLLCALLLGNVIVNAAISILFGELTSGLLALAISSLGIVIFGEIIPQSICVKKGLAVGAHTIMITQFFIALTYVLSWPVSKLLDCLLGEEYEGYDRKRLMELMKMSMKENGLLSNELKIAVGAMELADKVVEQVMTKIDDVFMLPDETILNAKTIAEIVQIGYTRIPVYSDGDRNNVTGLLIVKDLALLDPDDNFSVRTVCGYHQHLVKYVFNDTPLAIVLESFKKGDGHLAMVKRVHVSEESVEDPSYNLVGLVTLEDIVEEILQAEIVDEFDVVTDNKGRSKTARGKKNDLTRYFEKEAPHTQVSSHIQMVTLQFLVSNEVAFSDKYVHKGILERLISTSTRRVDMSYIKSAGGTESGVPKLAKLYTKDELSDRYVLILEGRAKVTIGQSGMMFEAGPFHAFGQELLVKLLAAANTLNRSNSVIDPTEVGCRRPDLMFKPDYSVTITEDCTYLEVTISSFINAYRSTLMLRDKEAMDGMGGTSSLPVSLSSSEQSLLVDIAPISVPSTGNTPSGIRRQSIIEAREAVAALNAREQRHKNRTPVDEVELGLLKEKVGESST
ncbi:cnnm-1 [Pristionchus pacificus]|nr:cnnm-1 [Pristionchus pacificus]